MNPQPDRLALLAKLRLIVGNKSDDGKVPETRIFCIEDGEPISGEYWSPDGYPHRDHTRLRAFIFTSTTKWEFRDDGELRHFSVGTILWRPGKREPEYCLFRRRAYPIGYYTIPSGHLEMGEDPQAAALRETYEETELGILSVAPFFEGEIQDECRRGSDYHYWYAYRCECVGEPRLSIEADIMGWFTKNDILSELKLTKPTGILFTKLFGEPPRYIRQT